MNLEEIKSQMCGVKANERGFVCRCPLHEDKRPSLSFWIDDEGRIAFNCFAGCSHKELEKYLVNEGLLKEGILDQKPEATYEYRDEKDTLLYTKIRYPGKRFAVTTPNGEPFRSVRKVLYGTEQLKDFPNEAVVIVEGEKDVLTLFDKFLDKLNFFPTTNTDGAGKWRKEYSKQLEGRKVIIITDHDLPGEKHGNVIAASLEEIANSVKIIPVGHFFSRINVRPNKGSDITDWFEQGGTPKQFSDVIEESLKLSAVSSSRLEDPNLERELICYLLSQSSDNPLFEKINTSLFSVVEYRQIYSALHELSGLNSLPVSCSFLKRHSALKGFSNYSILEALFRESKKELTKDYVDVIFNILSTAYLGRELTNILEGYLKETKTSAEFFTIAENCQQHIQQLITPFNSSSAGVRQVSKEVIKKLEYRMEHTSELSGVATGFQSLDGLTDGFQPADFIVLAARPGMGKTALALNIIEHVAFKENKPVLMFSLEMSRHQLIQRLLSSLSGIDNVRIKTGDVTKEELDNLYKWADFIASQDNFLLDDTGGLTIAEIVRRSRNKAKKGLSLIVLDYLQLIRHSSTTREREVAEISASLKALAKELSVPVLCLAQLNRQVEGRSEKRPIMSDLRDSGSIEQDADLIGFIYRPEVYGQEGSAELIVSKNRNGPLKVIKLSFDGARTRFTESVNRVITDKKAAITFYEEELI
jgi:replicative DNA helicase